MSSLYPYCSGRWSRTAVMANVLIDGVDVLILIVVEDGHVLSIDNLLVAFPDKS